MKWILPTILAIFVSATVSVVADSGYAQNYTEPQMEMDKEIGRLFNSRDPDDIIGAATKLGNSGQKAAFAVPYLVRVLDDLESRKMEVILKKSEATKAIVNALQNIAGQNYGTDVKKWKKYMAR